MAIEPIDRILAEKYIRLRSKLDELRGAAANLQKELDEHVAVMNEYFTERNLKTIRFDDLGSITLRAPIARARYEEENEPAVFEFMAANGGEACIKSSVHPSTFSSFIRELIEKGIAIPDYIEVYHQPTFVLRRTGTDE